MSQTSPTSTGHKRRKSRWIGGLDLHVSPPQVAEGICMSLPISRVVNDSPNSLATVFCVCAKPSTAKFLCDVTVEEPDM